MNRRLEEIVKPKPRTRRVPTTRAVLAATALCAVALLAPAAANAAVRYAAPSGGLTTGDCTTRATACEVNRAVETVPNSGDEVILIAGVYEIGADTLFVPGNVDVHGEAAPRHTEVTSSANNYTVALNNDGARIADVTLTHNSGQFGAVSLSSQSLVERVVARSSLANVQTCQLWKGVIRDTTCWSSGANGQAAGTSLAGPSGTHTPVLANVTAVATGSASAGVSFNAAGAGVNLHAGLRNVIADGTVADIRAFSSNGATGTTVDAGTSAWIQSNNGSTIPGATPGTITANNAQGNVPTIPAMTSPNSGDFHLKPGSMAIDRGADDDIIGTADIDEQARFQGETIDIGADEFIENHVRYAEPGGNGPEPCLQADPCDLKPAVEGNASDGDQVVLAEGTYALDASSASIDDAVAVRPDAGAEVNVTATGNYGLILQDPGATLADVAIDTTDGTALYVGSGVAERIRAHASGAGDNACGLAGGTIRDSVCFSDGPTNGGGVGLNLSASGNRTATLRNVTAVAVGAGSDGMRFGYTGGSFDVNARNVIASGTDRDVRAGNDVSVDLDHSNYATVSPSGNATITDAGTLSNQTEEPLFVDAATGDLHQLEGSPTVDKGTSEDLGGADIDGESRQSGTLPDIGADEFQHAVIPPPPPPPDEGDKVNSGGTAGKKCRKPKGKKPKGAKKKRCKKRKRP